MEQQQDARVLTLVFAFIRYLTADRHQGTLPNILTPPRRLCFRLHLFVSRITNKLLAWFSWSSVEGCCSNPLRIGVDPNQIQKGFFTFADIARSSFWPWQNKRHTSSITVDGFKFNWDRNDYKNNKTFAVIMDPNNQSNHVSCSHLNQKRVLQSGLIWISFQSDRSVV